MNERGIIKDARVLIVDDQAPNVLLLEGMLHHAGYSNLRSTTDSRTVESIFGEFRPDILLLDLHMLGLTGFEVMERLRDVIDKETYLPILVLTADMSAATKQRALAGGAKDFLAKPFDLIEVLLRIENLLETRFLHLKLQGQNQTLELEVGERTCELEEARVEMLERLSLAAEFRDDDTGQHTQRVGRLSALLAGRLGLPDDQVALIRSAAPLHDIGKIGIPDSILLKPEGLDPDEFRVMSTHTTIGGEILSGSHSPLLQLAERIAVSHHECWDGSGYPHGLRGDEIPLVGRIVSVADVFDALTHERPYKSAWPLQAAAAEIDRLSGGKFDPRVVDAFRGLHLDGLLTPGAVADGEDEGSPATGTPSQARADLT